MNRAHLLIIPISFIAAGVTGCKGDSPVEPSGPDFISITSLSPPAGSTLTPGSRLTITAKVRYQESCEPAPWSAWDAGVTLSMSLRGEGRELSPTARQGVRAGQGTATIANTLDVPASGVGEVRLLLMVHSTGLGCLFDWSSVGASYPVGSQDLRQPA